MFSFKNWVAIGLFLFGTTFLWMTRDFLANPREGTGVLWSVIQALVFAAILGFAVAAWGVFKEGAWWEPVAAVRDRGDGGTRALRDRRPTGR